MISSLFSFKVNVIVFESEYILQFHQEICLLKIITKIFASILKGLRFVTVTTYMQSTIV